MSSRTPRLAHRVDAIAPFRVMELVKRANALAAAGQPVIQMNIGEPDFTAPPAVVAALKRAADQGLSQYTPALGIAPLRDAIARDYGVRHGMQIAYGLDKHLTPAKVREIAPDVIYYPSVGMATWWVAISNLRLAPIQVAGMIGAGRNRVRTGRQRGGADREGERGGKRHARRHLSVCVGAER